MKSILVRLTKAAIVILSAGAIMSALYFHYRPDQTVAEVTHSGPKPQAAVPASVDHDLLVLEAAARKKPGHAPVLFKLATLAEAAGRTSDARKYLHEILLKEPDNLDARIELGKLLFETGDVVGALEQNRTVLKSRPDHPDALYNLGAIYANIGNEQLAREHWSRVASTSPSSESGRRARESLGQLGQVPGKDK